MKKLTIALLFTVAFNLLLTPLHASSPVHPIGSGRGPATKTTRARVKASFGALAAFGLAGGFGYASYRLFRELNHINSLIKDAKTKGAAFVEIKGKNGQVEIVSVKKMKKRRDLYITLGVTSSLGVLALTGGGALLVKYAITN